MTDQHFDLLQEIGGVGHLKLGLQGGTGAGKTYTAVEVAIGLKLDWGLPGPIAIFDTEKGSAFVRERVERETGQKLLGLLARSRDKLLAWLDQCARAGVSVAIVDSATHISDETRNSFVAQRNRQKGRSPNDRRLQIDEIMAVQDAWRPVVDGVLNYPGHLIVCGRLGFEWSHEDVDGSGNLTLVRTDRKMKAMGGLGYEFDLVCDIERETRRLAPGHAPPEGQRDRRKRTILTDESVHVLTVVKDRFDELDGAQVENPTYEFFKTYTDKLERGACLAVDLESETDHGLDNAGANKWRQERTRRTVLAEKIKEELERCYPGSASAAKASRQELAEMFLGTRSWTEISEQLDSEILQAGWIKLFRYCRTKFPVQRIEVDEAGRPLEAVEADQRRIAEARAIVEEAERRIAVAEGATVEGKLTVGDTSIVGEGPDTVIRAPEALQETGGDGASDALELEPPAPKTPKKKTARRRPSRKGDSLGAGDRAPAGPTVKIEDDVAV